MWIQSTGIARPRGRGLARVAGDRRGENRGACGEVRACEGEQSPDGAARPLRPVEPDRHRSRIGEQEEAERQREVTLPEHRVVHQRDQRSQVEGRAQRELRRRHVDVDQGRDERDRQGGRPRDRHPAEPDEPARDRDPHDEQADRRHQGQEDDPAQDHEARRRRSLGDGGDDELRRRPRVWAYGERPRAPYRVAVRRDHAPVDEVPAFRDVLERDDERGRIAGGARRRRRRDEVPARVGDRDDREA